MREDHLDNSTLRLPLLLDPRLGIDFESTPTIRVSHKFLHNLHVLPVCNERGGKTTPKRVPTDKLPNPRTRRRRPRNV